jgi:threonyl-tRNA synthetase
MGKKIRDGKVNKIPYMIVVGDREMNEKMIMVESRGIDKGEKMSLAGFIIKISEEIKNRKD